ncbi:tetratricopeptide repeat protein [Idiomarina sp.]|mgnify:CR=1 FL=1|uniref:tetratricopeptide repeat protein n=1 Tax=Idiomarina sp. TaxID=1874361 RepID=UPI001D857F70|nr:tetratricopeptide repeat protein [Idiomarina sp.]MCJ8316736.1 tetratricopeptide repeat protein [Idiomarina sp.]NQZ16380.1 tetratricopeptide repeat protein [Idiomarina sp.]
MSLINKVLKDLDKRGQEPFDREAGGSAVERSEPRTKLPWVVLALAVVGISAGIVLWPANDSQTMTVYEAEQSLQPEKVQQKPAQTESPRAEARSNDGELNSNLDEPETASTDKRATVRQLEARTDNKLSESQEPELKQTERLAEAQSEKPPGQVPEGTQERAEEKSTENDSVFVKKSVELTPEQIAQQNIEKAEKAQQQGRLTQAEEYWRQALAVTPDNKRVRKQLAALQYGRNKVTDALATLEVGFQRDRTDTDFRMLSARILEREARPGAALNVLLKSWPSADIKPDYSQKIALLAQDTGNYEVAETAYTRLAQAQPNEGRWFVGKAIAQENQGSAAALTSYQQALERVTHEPTRQFIEQKIATLSAQANSAGKP